MDAMRRSPDRAHAEDGISLIELMVALFVMSLVVGGVAATMLSSLRVTQTARGTSIAANLGNAELELVRAVDPAELTLGRTERSTVVGNATYTIAREAEWVGIDATESACRATGGDVDVLRVSVEVSWDGPNPGETVTQTTIAPSVGAYDPQSGHVIVRVIDGDEAPVAGEKVHLRTPGGAETFQLTTREGCVVFDHLAPGDHEVWLETMGKVDKAGRRLSEQGAVVIAAATTNVTFAYERAATVDVTLVGSDPAASVPDAVEVVVGNTALQPAGTAAFPGEGTARRIDTLYPFASGYEGWGAVAECRDADPANHVDVSAPVWPTVPGATEVVELVLPTVDFRLGALVDLGGDGDEGRQAFAGIPGRLVQAVHAPEEDGCDGATVQVGTTDLQGRVLVALPLGTWTLEYDADGDGDIDGLDRLLMTVLPLGAPSRTVLLEDVATMTVYAGIGP